MTIIRWCSYRYFTKYFTFLSIGSLFYFTFYYAFIKWQITDQIKRKGRNYVERYEEQTIKSNSNYKCNLLPC